MKDSTITHRTYPSHFYNLIKRENTLNYSRTPRGKGFNVKRLIQNQPAWYVSEAAEPQKKTLILADWTAADWKKEKITAVQNTLNQLLDDGFSVSVWLDGKLTALTRKNIHKLTDCDYLSKITPALEETINNAAKLQLGLTADDVFILDDHWIESLIEKKDRPYQLSLAEYNKTRHDRTLIINSYRSKPLQEIAIDEFPVRENRLSKLQEAFPHLPVKRQIKKVVLHKHPMLKCSDALRPDEYQTVEEIDVHSDLSKVTDLLAEMPNLKYFQANMISSMPNVKKPFPTLPHLIELLCASEIQPEDMHALLSHSPHIKRLKMPLIANSKWLFQPIVLLDLEELTIDAAGWHLPSDKMLSDLLPSAKHLKIIRFTGFFNNTKTKKLNLKSILDNLEELHLGTLKFDNIINDEKELQFNNLKKLSFIEKDTAVDTKISAKNLEKLKCYLSNDGVLVNSILQEANKLKKLKIQCSNGKACIQNFSANDLRELTLENIRCPDIDQILSQSSKLTKLSLKKIVTINNINLTAIALGALKHLTISECNLLGIDAMLSKTPNLRSLSLTSISLTEPFNNKLTLLPYLETLDLSDITISAENLHHLLIAAPNLKLIKFRLSSFEGGFISEPIYLPALEHFFSDSEISGKAITQIFSHAHQLKTLTLKLKDGLDPDQFDFPKLEKLNISAKPSPKSLTSLLRKSPNLKKLHINHKVGSFPSELCLRKLTHLNIISCENDVDLTNLLVHANKLEQIDICSSTLSPKILSDKLHFPNLKTLNLSWCEISANTLKNLLKLAPHVQTIHLEYCSNFEMDEELEQLLLGKTFDNISTCDIDKLFPIKPDQSRKTKAISPQASSPTQSNPSTRKPPEPDKNQTTSVDANTDGKEKSVFDINQVFYAVGEPDPSLQVNYYRINTYDTLNIRNTPCSPSAAFELTNSGPIDFDKAHNITPVRNLLKHAQKLAEEGKNRRFLIGRHALTLTNKWQALPSYSPNEVMVHYESEPEVDCLEFQYSKRDSLYYVRKKTPGSQNIAFDFLVKAERHSPTVSLPDEIEKIATDFVRNFGAGTLDLQGKKEPTGRDYLQSILKDKKGACRHRAVAFKALMNQKHPNIRVRVVVNTCHVFVEIHHQGQWVKRCLGGYPGQLNITQNPPVIKEEDKGKEKVKEQALKPSEDEDKKPQQIVTSIQYEEPKRHVSLDLYYNKRLQTWKNDLEQVSSVLHYCQLIVQPDDKKKRLVKLTQSSDIQALQLSLQGYCKSLSRPCFYVGSPDDLICSAPYLVHQSGDTGTLFKGPGGPLYDFLQVHQDPDNPSVLLVNYDSFNADDIVRFNALLDQVRYADGTPVPPDTRIIGLINTHKPGCYQGSDFYSRFDRQEKCPLTSQQLQDHISNTVPLNLIAIDEEGPGETAKIDLFFSSDWKARLLGSWSIQGDQFVFKPGELIKAFDKNHPIEIINGPWENPHFHAFWQQAALLGYIEYEGLRLPWPAQTPLYRSEGFNWDSLTSIMQFNDVPHDNAFVLNPGLIDEFFNRYSIDNQTGKLTTLPGYIEAFAGKRLDVTLSREINELAWASLLSACQEHRVHLHVHRLPGVELPTVIAHEPPSETGLPMTEWHQTLETTTLIQSTDLDTTLAQITAEDASWRIIDVSELQADDLLVYTHSDFDEKTNRFIFESREQGFLKALQNNQNVMLTGTISQELADHLTPLLLQRQQSKTPSGQLVILTPNNPFVFLAAKQHQVNSEEKKRVLQARFPQAALNEDELEAPLTTIQAKLAYQARYPQEARGEQPWEGLTSLTRETRLPTFDKENSEALARAFENQRIEAVEKTLSNSPYVFLTGLTGVGKSTFVETYFTSVKNRLYHGEGQMKAWAMDRSGKRPILFIDEANLSAKQWTEFEGLFHNPPTIYLDGKLYPLTENHRVIFAGNPLNYGDERVLAPFFQRHGNAVVFEPLTGEFLYESVLKPLFADTPLQEQAQALAERPLEIYRFIVEASKTGEILMSPRELQMMGLLVVSAFKQHDKESAAVSKAKAAARYYAYQLAKGLVPDAKKHEFETRFACTYPYQPRELPASYGDFIITESRKPLIHQLQNLLDLRHYRTGPTAQKAHLYGGLGGIIVEGAPGQGKSELITHLLVTQGYEEAHENDKQRPAKPFYRIPASMSTDKKKELLLNAFHQGAVVIVDEINSCPMLESFLNDLLMGKTPDKKPPKNPGFLLIGTQNPVTMAGRRAPSPALARRLLAEVLPDYTQEELNAILVQKGLRAEQASIMVNAYLNNLKKARQEGLNPQPTFRDLERLAKEESAKTQTPSEAPVTAPSSTEKEEIQEDNALFDDLKKAILVQIDHYLEWQKNHNIHRRTHKLGLFTHFRHGKFGMSRAKALKANINHTENIKHLLETLKNHFQKDLRIHNHSLDSYLTDVLAQATFDKLLSLDQKSYDTSIKKQRALLIKAILEQRPEPLFQPK